MTSPSTQPYELGVSPRVSKVERNVGITAFASLTAALIAGTGGAYASSNLSLYPAAAVRPIIIVVDHDRRRPSQQRYVSKSQVLLKLRESFGLNLSQLARVFGVTRQTVYDWLQGAEPRASVAAKFWRLSEVAKQMDALGIARPSSVLCKPLEGQRTLLELLESDGPLEEAIAGLPAFLSREATATHAWRSRNNGKRRHDPESSSRVIS